MILIEKYIQQIGRKVTTVAQLGRLRQTLLIKEKRKHLSRTSDRVSNMFGAQVLKV
jgi:hypothetical protein